MTETHEERAVREAVAAWKETGDLPAAAPQGARDVVAFVQAVREIMRPCEN